MNNTPKLNIIMFNMSKYRNWQKGVVNRNFHVLHNLVKRDEINKIIAVDFLPFNWKKAIKSFILDQILRDTRGTVIFGDLTSRCWQISSKILVYSTVDSVINPQRIITELNKIILKEKMADNLIIWNYNPLYIDYFNNLDQKLNIFDAVDNWAEHSGYESYKNKLAKNYQIIQNKSELIFTVSANLKNELFKNQANTHWLPNAVDLEYFQSVTEISPKLNKIPKPIIGFLGILQDRIDLEILLTLAKNNPDKSIVLAGPVWPNFPKNKLQEFKNIYFLGPISYQEIPALYNGFNVGIIPYQVNEFIKSTDPMKFYEYLAAGLPIVSTYVPGIERFGSLIKVAKSPEEFNNLVNKALNEKRGLTQEKLEMLKNNTWRHRIEEMLELIYEKF
ncbi:MAG: glycosyltransferase [Candidatus Parcubacteria bacterium]|nr:glycosyltransferase [Candidatus Parcubacteria bacterium]